MTAFGTVFRLDVGSAYLVRGILHDYLGPALTPETGGLVHAFRRREWRPNTRDQLLVTLVPENEIEGSVTRFGVGTSAYGSGSSRQIDGRPRSS